MQEQLQITRCDSYQEEVLDEQMEKEVYDLSEKEIETIQQFRSDQRKIKYQKLPILISILKDCLHGSNLCDLANRYDKYKTKLQNVSEKEQHLDEIINSVMFDQDKSKINPYQSNYQSKSVIISAEIEEKNSDKKYLLQQSLENLFSDLQSINSQNSELKSKISQYFENLWISSSSSSFWRNQHLNVLNYDLKERQEHYQDVQLSIIPILEKEKQDLQLKCDQQRLTLINHKALLKENQNIPQQYSEQQEYIEQLISGSSELAHQISSTKEKVEQLKQAQVIMQLEKKIEQFCTTLLSKRYEDRKLILLGLQQILEKGKIKVMKNFKGSQNQSILEIENENDNFKSEIDLLSQNQYIVTGQQKMESFKQQIQAKKQQIKMKQQQISEENKRILQEISTLDSRGYQQQILELQLKQEQFQEEYRQYENDIQQLGDTILAAQMMIDDLDQQCALQQQRNSQKQLTPYQRLFRKLKGNNNL